MKLEGYSGAMCNKHDRVIIIIIIIIDKTDAGLNGLCIRDITLIYDVINMYNTGNC